MLIENKGLPLRSKAITWVNGDTVPVDLSFLERAMKRMDAPVIREFGIHFNGSVSGVTATMKAEDADLILRRITIKDRAGTLYDLGGKLARIVEQVEVGRRQYDGNDGTAIASGATNTSYNLYRRVIFDTEKAHRGADTALPLLHMLEGGEFTLQLGDVAGGGVNSGTIRVYAIVHDERRRQAKARMTWREQSITAAEDTYPMGGSVRALFATSLLTTAGYTALSGITAIDSPELGMADLDKHLLYQEYRRQAKDRSSDDEFIADNAIMLVNPSTGQHIGKMPDLDTALIDFGTTITSGKLVRCVIENRDPALAAEWLGFPDVGAFAEAVKERGRVASKGGSGQSVTNWDPKLVRRMALDV